MAGPTLRCGPPGDGDRPARHVGDQDVLLTQPAIRPVRSAKRLDSKKAIAARRVKDREPWLRNAL